MKVNLKTWWKERIQAAANDAALNQFFSVNERGINNEQHRGKTGKTSEYYGGGAYGHSV